MNSIDSAIAAIKTLEDIGYSYREGTERWRPPLIPKSGFSFDDKRLADQYKTLGRYLQDNSDVLPHSILGKTWAEAAIEIISKSKITPHMTMTPLEDTICSELLAHFPGHQTGAITKAIIAGLKRRGEA